jgi:hypothetical protein
MRLITSALTISTLTAAVLLAGLPASATDAAKSIVLAQAQTQTDTKMAAPKKATAEKKAAAPMGAGSNVQGTKKVGPSKLATHDCRLNGTVVEIQDDRCGASHQYCKINGVSQCIEIRD